ncbi:MAG: PIN domain-containing protein [Oscillospiraceae bacterium]|nr:PIN domain-containing protein [Oscillospiraceae bacterium]
MRNITALVDTNIFLDIAFNRQKYAEKSLEILSMNNFTKLIVCKQIFDIHYILKKRGIFTSDIINFIKTIRLNCTILDLTVEDVDNTLKKIDMEDFEDAVISIRADRFKADYIITRNIKDFINSKVKAITPENFLKIIQNN